MCFDNADIFEERETEMVIFTLSGVEMISEVFPLETLDTSKPSLALLLPTNIKKQPINILCYTGLHYSNFDDPI